MSDQITNYKCPSCSGPLHFDGALGKLKCDYCESAFEPAEIEALYAEENKKAEMAAEASAEAENPAETTWDTSHIGSEWGQEAEGMKTYRCPSCGAELICDESTAATSCPYCGNPAVVPGQFRGILKPDYVIPFKSKREDAIAALKAHCRGKFLLPKAFADQNHLEEIKGIYVPFWLFDGTVSADIRFHCTRSHMHFEGDDRVTVTEYFRVRRAGSMAFSRIPVDASRKMPDEYMDSLEPFCYDEMVDFSKAYLPGFFADKYDEDVEQCASRAEERVRNSAVNLLTRDATRGYQTCTPVHKNLRLERGEVKYALLPVWVLHTKWRDRNFLFTMNGQTGKVVGELPVSVGRFLILLFLCFVGFSVLAFLILLALSSM